MKIYEIHQAILDCIDAEGEIIDIERFGELQLEMNDKVDNLACLYKQFKAEADSIKCEKKRLEEREKSKEAQADRLKDYLSTILNGQKFETGRNKISWRASTSVNVSDPDVLNEEYVRVKEVREPDREAIKTAIDKGINVVGAEIVVKNNIQIK